MPAIITAIAPGSPAARTRVAAGDALLAINGHLIADVLDYRFYAAERVLRLRLRRPTGREYTLRLRKEQYEDLGLHFADGLMDNQRQCKNKCIFCFIDQLPPGLRPSLYGKDDDARLSFLFGNYITLTNLTEREVQRIIAMRLSLVNISVHTMNPALRVRMMRNPKAGESLALLERFTLAGLDLNIQLVLCPGWNDGAELRFSLEQLLALPGGRVRSIAAVPVGLTRHREGLTQLRAFCCAEAGLVIDCIGEMRDRAAELGLETEICPSDEFFLLAQRDPPAAAYYGAFAQLENGVGLWALLRQDVLALLADADAVAALLAQVPADTPRRFTLATGRAAAPLLRFLVDECAKVWHNMEVQVIAIQNRFFGEAITVAGLLTGEDICTQLAGVPLGAEVLLPAVCLRHERDLTLDGRTLAELSTRLGVPCKVVENGAEPLLDALLGIVEEKSV
ncbi:MAG: DUF512 domain-containing protein [Oscillospiraceae bacterium]|jgi:putative radical SAM enzyme (TIGR03279 family)|nr:DUF512 domain-containing protein [Oscillospiraceae bacterium]